MRIEKLLLGLFWITLFACDANSQKKVAPQNPIVQKNISVGYTDEFPKPVGYINDFEQILTPEQREELEKALSEYERKTSREIAVITIDSIAPYQGILPYTTALLNTWGVGKSQKNNGLVITISKNLRQVAIGTGYGTEKILTDAVCKKIIDSIMNPEFKDERFFEGLEKGLDKIKEYWEEQ
ncbi:TPM domain-containing protein [Sinomicrobium pectinilyticum]|uniref:TPM domain-containing protein n=1 Tax=Sinomicrobium pectinilyticum TaxID=1084421 RepID=A0A3N0EUB5_SINP1|nr:TPM domain-containing protein [Sinomicrobium pectinilyticum]RNL91458.1 TPM domain-containing protein [Sinomicrobium pectinilyticum]